jgi:hypothetical protein
MSLLPRKDNCKMSGSQMIYISNFTHDQKKESEFYIRNTQEKTLIRVIDPKQIELLTHCVYGPQVKESDIVQLINEGYQYFESVDEFIKWEKEMMEQLREK